MLVFVAVVSAIIAVLIAMMKSSNTTQQSETRMTLGIKVFVVTFVILYFGLVFFTPNISNIVKTHEIETCDPDF